MQNDENACLFSLNTFSEPMRHEGASVRLDDEKDEINPRRDARRTFEAGIAGLASVPWMPQHPGRIEQTNTLQRNQSSCPQEAPCQVAFSSRKSHLAHSLQRHVYSDFALRLFPQGSI
jgi:hypothetical protein